MTFIYTQILDSILYFNWKTMAWLNLTNLFKIRKEDEEAI